MRIVTDEKDRQAYKEFLEKHERCNFQQSPEWAKVKGNWINEIVLAEDESGKIIGAVSILIRKIPIFGNIMYSSRGPTCDIHDISVMKQLTDGIKELAKKYKAIVYKAEPDILSSDEEYRKIVTSLGYKIKDDAKNFREEIQPRYVFRLDIKNKTEDEIFAGFHSKTRYNVRLAIKKGVEVKEGTREDLKDFHKIMVETGARDGFIIRPLSYFEKIYDEMGEEHARIYIAEYEGKPIAATLPIYYGNKVWYLYDEMAPEHMKLLMAYHDGKPISGVIPIFYGNKTWYLYGASSNEHRNLMPNYLLQWEMIKMAIARKDDVYDFRGVSGVVDENQPQYGLHRFKKGFGAKFTEFIGEIYIPFKPVKYSLYKFSEKAFRTLRQIKRKISK